MWNQPGKKEKKKNMSQHKLETQNARRIRGRIAGVFFPVLVQKCDMWLTFPLEYDIKRAWSHFVGHTHGGALGDLFYPSTEQITLALPFMPNLWSCMCTYIPRIIGQCHWLDVMIFSCHPQRAVLITTGQLFSSLLLMLLPAAWLIYPTESHVFMFVPLLSTAATALLFVFVFMNIEAKKARLTILSGSI